MKKKIHNYLNGVATELIITLKSSSDNFVDVIKILVVSNCYNKSYKFVYYR